jgi:hypothetical protein
VARVNYREIRDRFTHIDATWISYVISEPGESHYSVRFYAWWEHPTYRELAKSGEWQAQWPPEAEKVVTVYPVGLVKACVSSTALAINWEFVDPPDPLLWEFETYEHVACKDALPPETFIKLPSMIAAALPYHAEPASVSLLLNPLRWEAARTGRLPATALGPGLRPGGFNLGRFPQSVVGSVCSVLEELGVGYLKQEPLPPPEKLPVMLLIDAEDYLIAEDFEVDVPEFEHHPDWITSTTTETPRDWRRVFGAPRGTHGHEHR